MVADFESRRNERESEWMLDKDALLHALEKLTFMPEIDLFASRINNQFPSYVSYNPDPTASAIDAFSLDWSVLKLYAFPPFSVIPACLSKMVSDQATGIVVLPDWPTQSWFPKVLHMMVKERVLMKARKDLLFLPSHPSEVHPLWEKTQSDGMSIIRETLNHIGLSPSAQKGVMASWRPGTSKQYDSYLRKWSCYCKDNGINRCHPTITQAIEFLVSLYSSGLGYRNVNSARSALSALIIMDDGSKFGEHPLVCHCLKRDL